MPTYYDPITLSELDIDENTVLYLVKVKNDTTNPELNTYSIKAVSSGLSQLPSDPHTHATQYWPINDTASFLLANQSDEKRKSLFFPNNQLTTKPLSKAEVLTYFGVDPEVDEAIPFNVEIGEALRNDWVNHIVARYYEANVRDWLNEIALNCERLIEQIRSFPLEECYLKPERNGFLQEIQEIQVSLARNNEDIVGLARGLTDLETQLKHKLDEYKEGPELRQSRQDTRDYVAGLGKACYRLIDEVSSFPLDESLRIERDMFLQEMQKRIINSGFGTRNLGDVKDTELGRVHRELKDKLAEYNNLNSAHDVSSTMGFEVNLTSAPSAETANTLQQTLRTGNLREQILERLNGAASLDLSDDDIGKIGNEGMIFLAEALRTNTTLQTLDLRMNQIGIEGTLALTETLKINATLLVLNLSGNHIGPQGGFALANALKINATLRTLYLNSCFIETDGVVALTDALKANTTLLMLDLTQNFIDPNGAVALVDMLKTNNTLQALYLMANHFLSSEGVVAFADALKTNTALHILDLNLTNTDDIRSEDVITIENALIHNYTLFMLTGGFTNDRIQAYLQRNRTIQSLLLNLEKFVSREEIDLDRLSESVSELETLVPELTTDSDVLPAYIVERYQLMRGLCCLKCGEPNEVLRHLQGPINDKRLQPAVELLTMEALMALNLKDIPHEAQCAYYEWLFYQARHHPESMAFRVSMAGLINPQADASLSAIQNTDIQLTSGVPILNYEKLFAIGIEARQRLNETPNTSESQLLDKLLLTSDYHPLTAQYLWQCPTVRQLYHKHYPNKAAFQLCEDYLLCAPELSKVHEYHVDNVMQHSEIHIVEHYQRALAVEARRPPFVTVQDRVTRAKEILLDKLQSTLESSERARLK